MRLKEKEKGAAAKADMPRLATMDPESRSRFSALAGSKKRNSTALT